MNISPFTRVAANLANMGYYPTSTEDAKAIGSYLRGYDCTIIDPCCGAGDALNTITKYMTGYADTLGIEIEETRAEKAKENVKMVLHEDFFSVQIDKGSFGAVFCNPPYFSNDSLHVPFIEKSTEILAPEGILILIVPNYEIAGKTAGFLSSFYENIKIFKAIDQHYSQVIVFGQKRKSPELKEGDEITLLGQKTETIKRDSYNDEYYEIPETKPLEDIRILIKGLDPVKVEEILNTFDEDLKKLHALIPESSSVKRPLLPLRKGHLAQILASGLTDGVIEHPETGQRFLIKGTTNRIEEVTETTEEAVKVINKDVVTILMMDQEGNIETIK